MRRRLLLALVGLTGAILTGAVIPLGLRASAHDYAGYVEDAQSRARMAAAAAGTKHYFVEQDQTPGITGDDTKDNDTKGHIVRAGPTTTLRATTPIRAHPARTSLRGEGTGHVCPRVPDECPGTATGCGRQASST